ncbi:MAG: hypothetical protein GX808_03045 [Syntrophomonadaceae bacterium]|jgi:hypothetical protein|nr:hypothetical protein [Syntrophomonadaceae bacterium]
MKRGSVKEKLLVIGISILLAFSLTACQSNESSNGNKDNGNTPAVKNDENNKDVQKVEIELEFTEEGIIKPKIAEKIIKETSDQLIQAIGSKDAELIAGFIHPVKGVRFTPYTYVSPDIDQVFNQEQMKNFFDDQKVYFWGNYDGTGDEIRLTPGEYYDKFVYTEDFINAEEVGYNQVLSLGNMLENQFEVYENPIIVEYYFSGFDPKYEGIDWRSLRLVFEEYEDQWKLVGIINNQWTI